MTPVQKYKNASSFRMAIQDKLNQLSKETGQDVQRLYRQVAYSRFLARLFHKNDIEWVLKGGHALELRLQKCRATKDIDLALKDSKAFGSNDDEQSSALRDLLIDKAQQDLNDFFVFTVSAPILEIDAAPYGGTRFSVNCYINGKVFSKFSVDIGIGDVWIQPQSELTLLGNLDELCLKPAQVKVISLEQHVAEKVHALTVPRQGPNSRVRDLVDLFLIFKFESVDPTRMQEAMERTFARRGTHPIPMVLPVPDQAWAQPLERMMRSLGEDGKVDEVYRFVNDSLKAVTRNGSPAKD